MEDKAKNIREQNIVIQNREKSVITGVEDILSFDDELVIVKTGEKDAEKQFLGYEFSNRRGSEGMHAIRKGKSVDECTQLYDNDRFDNPLKASTYIYKAFNKTSSDIDETLNDNVSKVNLLDMLTFDRVDFEKNINLNSKKKVKIESKFELYKLGELVENLDNKRIPLSKNERISGEIPYYGATGIIDYVSKYIFDEKLVLIGEDGAKWGANENSAFSIEGKTWVNNHAHVLRPNRNKILDTYLIEILNKYDLSSYITGQNVPKLNQANLNSIQIPLPPLDIQQKIVEEIEKVEKVATENKIKIDKNNHTINELLLKLYDSSDDKIRLSDNNVFSLSIGKRVLNSELSDKNTVPVYSANTVTPFGYIDKLLIKDFSKSSVIWGIDGDWMVNTIDKGIQFYPTDHCGIIRLKKDNILEERYLAFALNKEGVKIGFSRTKRASIDRISGIIIPLPKYSEQQKIVYQIEKLEKQIAQAQSIIDNSKQQKQAILDKYLK